MNTKLLLVIMGSLLLTSCVNILKLSDLRPENYEFPNDRAKAQRLMTEMGEAHKIDLWNNIDTYEVTFEDEFYGFFGKQANSFKTNPARFSLTYSAKSYDGQMKFLNGKNLGETWGIQDWQTYTKEGEQVEIKDNKDMKFWIPTYQYFIEFPRRIQEATVVDYVESKTINGIKVEGIIASWNTIDPQKHIDQYIIWLNAETKQIVKVEYTVRETYKFISGAASFESYKLFNGIPIPTKLPVESNLVKDNLHQMCIENFKVNPVSEASLRPLGEDVKAEKN